MNNTEIANSISLRSQAVATPALPGSIALQTIAGALKQVDDQGNASSIGGGGGTVTSVTASGPLASSGGSTPNITSLGLKTGVAVVATANISLTGEQTIDGVTTSGSRVLCTAQSTGTQNGIYVSASGAWSRAADFNADAQISTGCVVPVTSGTLYAGSEWMVTNATPSLASGVTFAQVGPPSFGSDTLVKLPNGSNALVNSLELINTLTTATAGAEVSQWVIKLLSAGAQTTLVTLNPTALTFASSQMIGPVGSSANPTYTFTGHTTHGMSYSSGSLAFSVAGALSFYSDGAGTLHLATSAGAQVDFGGVGLLKNGGGGGLHFQISNALASSGGTVDMSATRFEFCAGANVASANTLTLGMDGNFFTITGTTQVNNITQTNWQAGSRIMLKLASGITIKNNNGGSGSVFLRAGSDLTTSGTYLLELACDGTNWYQAG